MSETGSKGTELRGIERMSGSDVFRLDDLFRRGASKPVGHEQYVRMVSIQMTSDFGAAITDVFLREGPARDTSVGGRAGSHARYRLRE